MKPILVLAAVVLSVGAGLAQRRPPEPLVRQPVRGARGAVAAGSDYATGAGMRMLVAGGNAVDAGIGDRVLVVTEGYSAMTAVGRPNSPIDMAVIGFIDRIDLLPGEA